MTDVNISKQAEKHIKQLEVGERVKVSQIFKDDNNEYVVVDKKAHPSASAIDYTIVMPQYASEYNNHRESFDEDRSRLFYKDEIVGYVNITGDAYFEGEQKEGRITRS